MHPESAVIYPPNRPLNRIVMQPTTPVLSYLFFIDINGKGEVIISSSDVSGTGWYGSVFKYRTIEDAITFKHSSYHTGISTISDGRFFKNEYVLIAEDTKCLNLLNPNCETMRIEDSFENHDLIEQIAVWNDDSTVVVCGGRSVEILKVENNSRIVLTHDYRDYHTDTVVSVDVDEKQPGIFASASLDRRACVWDHRIPEPAMVLYVNEFSSLRSISCYPLDSNLFTIGSAAGDVYLVDRREPKQFVTVQNCFKNCSVHKTRFSDAGYLGVCGDNETVVVLDCKGDNLKQVHVRQFASVIRGLAWQNNELYACGFGKNIFKCPL